MPVNNMNPFAGLLGPGLAQQPAQNQFSLFNPGLAQQLGVLGNRPQLPTTAQQGAPDIQQLIDNFLGNLVQGAGFSQPSAGGLGSVADRLFTPRAGLPFIPPGAFPQATPSFPIPSSALVNQQAPGLVSGPVGGGINPFRGAGGGGGGRRFRLR